MSRLQGFNPRSCILWAQVAEVVVGLVFLAGAALKAADVNRFTIQIAYYGVLAKPGYLSAAAITTLAVETALGSALVLRCRFKGLTFAAVLALLALFTGLIAYAWAFHNLKDCGCFGRIEMSPGISIAKNIVLATLCILAWVGPIRGTLQASRPGLFFLRIAACVALACAVVLYSMLNLQPVKADERPFAPYVFDVDGTHFDLGQGEYFVAILSMTCPHCMASVEHINDLADTPGFLPVVALCYEEKPGTLDDFRMAAGPEFPLYSIGDQVRLFANLVGEGKDPPHFIYVRDGKRVKDWYEDVPSAQEVLDAGPPNG